MNRDQMVSFRATPAELEAFRDAARRLDTTVSDVLRRAETESPRPDPIPLGVQRLGLTGSFGR